MVKRIPLKVLPGATPEDMAIDYRAALHEVLQRPMNPQQGVSIDEMRASIRVLDAVDRADGTLELEDADYQHLKAKLDTMPWALVDRRILQFVDDVTNAG